MRVVRTRFLPDDAGLRFVETHAKTTATEASSRVTCRAIDSIEPDTRAHPDRIVTRPLRYTPAAMTDTSRSLDDLSPARVTTA
ncbi:hypothetical protein C3E98_045695, partial [Pseudomonas sp. MWU13-2625]